MRWIDARLSTPIDTLANQPVVPTLTALFSLFVSFLFGTGGF